MPCLDVDPGIGEAVRAAPAGAAPDLWPVFAALKPVPTLAIRGELSDVLSPATFERMAAEKPDLQRLTVARRGHPPLLDEPECVAAIDAFLAGSALMPQVQSVDGKQHKTTGHVNAYFPLFIPERLIMKEKDHVEG